jgi:hypothetical protein
VPGNGQNIRGNAVDNSYRSITCCLLDADKCRRLLPSIARPFLDNWTVPFHRGCNVTKVNDFRAAALWIVVLERIKFEAEIIKLVAPKSQQRANIFVVHIFLVITVQFWIELCESIDHTFQGIDVG